ncbi:MAG: c-type cytochrome biogenesis protein CcsB, partial [Microbacteriaceae bacterium]|nr:c-type cytochrome biogenesis protein CcsB [Microbacteriaceae bacterium]
MTDTFSQFSVLSLYSAMGLYAVAFILFTLDLSGLAPERLRLARIGLSITWLGFALQVVATALRGLAASRVPWANMYEFAMTGTLMMMLVFLVVNLKWDVRYLGAFITGFVLLALGISATRYYVEVVPLPPALQSYWLVIHVFVATLATG